MKHIAQLIRQHDGTTFELDSQTTVGRRDDCSIILDEGGVSRLHAQLTFADDGQLSIEDFSRNGTKVNGVAIQGPTLLQNDDVVRFDEHDFKVVAPIIERPDVEESKPANDPAMTQISEDAIREASGKSVYAEDAFKRKPLPERPAQEGTMLVLPTESGQYEPLDVRNFDGPALVTRNGQTPNTAFDLHDSQESWSVGSASGSNVQITDDGVSSQHAVIQRVGNTWEIMDQMATNVLRVNGTATNRCYLKTGDLISFGPIDCEFVLPSGYKPRKSKPGSKQSASNQSGAGKSRAKLWSIIIILALIAAAAFYLLKEGYFAELLKQFQE